MSDLTAARRKGLELIIRWQTKAPEGMTLPEWLAAGMPHKDKESI